MQIIQFVPLNEFHFSLICQWFNKPHVQAFYSLRVWTSEEVRNKLTPYLQHEKGIKGFVIYLDKQPVGYTQCYPIKDHPWENQDLPDDVILEAGGLDLFIGEEEYLGKGVSFQIINSFLKEHIWPSYKYCLVDPDVRNKASLRLFQKCGFARHKCIDYIDALGQSVMLQLLIKKRENFTMEFRKPPPLKKGDKVAILSPSSGLPYVFPWVYEQGLSQMKEIFGLEPVEFPTARKSPDYLSQHPEARAGDINAAFADPSIKGIIATIGGNDQIRILPYLDVELIKN